MRKLSMILAVFGLIIGFRSLPAQGSLEKFLRHPVKSGKELAACIRGEKGEENCLTSSRQKLLEAFQTHHPELHLTSIAGLADYAETLSMQMCPQIEVNMSGYNARNDQVADVSRFLGDKAHKKEKCLVDLTRNIYVVSADCGNPFNAKTESHAAIPYKPEEKVSLTPPPTHKDITATSIKDTIYIGVQADSLGVQVGNNGAYQWYQPGRSFADWPRVHFVMDILPPVSADQLQHNATGGIVSVKKERHHGSSFWTKAGYTALGAIVAGGVVCLLECGGNVRVRNSQTTAFATP